MPSLECSLQVQINERPGQGQISIVPCLSMDYGTFMHRCYAGYQFWHPTDNTESDGSYIGLISISWQDVALRTPQNQACLLTRKLCRCCAQNRADGGRHTRQWRAAEARRRNPGRSRRVSHALTAAPGARCARMHHHPLTTV